MEVEVVVVLVRAVAEVQVVGEVVGLLELHLRGQVGHATRLTPDHLDRARRAGVPWLTRLASGGIARSDLVRGRGLGLGLRLGLGLGLE